MKKEIKWFYEIGQTIRDDKRNIIISNREFRMRKYKNEKSKYEKKKNGTNILAINADGLKVG